MDGKKYNNVFYFASPDTPDLYGMDANFLLIFYWGTLKNNDFTYKELRGKVFFLTKQVCGSVWSE